MKTEKSPREIVLQYYPNANAVNIGCKNGKYYNIIFNTLVLGQGKTSKQAWKAAYHNL